MKTRLIGGIVLSALTLTVAAETQYGATSQMATVSVPVPNGYKPVCVVYGVATPILGDTYAQVVVVGETGSVSSDYMRWPYTEVVFDPAVSVNPPRAWSDGRARCLVNLTATAKRPLRKSASDDLKQGFRAALEIIDESTGLAVNVVPAQ